MPPQGPLDAGDALGARYRILRLLGAGGMGVVYQAWDEELGVAVALKVIRPEIASDPHSARELERRFKRELLLARQVTHRNVVRIHDLGEIDGVKYISMPFVEGDTLANILKNDGRLPLARALRIARQVANGLAAAHEVGVVHRDLKPENVMVDQEQALIMDFGIARSVSGHGGAMTATGAVVGTLEYMAPEQARGQQADARADIYAFGLMLYDMLVGRRRLESSESAVAEMMSRMTQPPAALRALDPHVPDALDRIVSKCLMPDPSQRYQTAAELLNDLNALDDNGAAPAAASPKLTLRAALLVGAGLVLLMVAAAVWFVVARGPATPAAQPEPVRVLVMDFSNRTGESIFEGALEQALGVALEEASYVTLFPRTRARELATQLVPGATQMDRQTGELLSRREGIDVLVTGAIESIERGYRLNVAAVDPSNGREIATFSTNAGGKSEVLQALPDMARRLRAELGESTDELARASRRETFTAASLDAAREYALAQDLQQKAKDEEAIEHYRRAVVADPNLGRAYSGWAISARRLGRQDEATQAWKKALALTDRMTDREKYRTLGAYYLDVAGDYARAIENFSALLKLYPADSAAAANLALSYFYVRDFGKALEYGQRSVELAPYELLQRNNYALFAMYAGDFDRASTEAREEIKLDPKLAKAYLPLAMAALAKHDFDGAKAAYESMRGAGTIEGTSIAMAGLADMAMYRGQFDGAITLLKEGIEADAQRRNAYGQATKLAVLAEAFQELGRGDAAVQSARNALSVLRADVVVVPAAYVLMRSGSGARDAQALADELGSKLQVDSRAYARLLHAELALGDKRIVDAVDGFREAIKLRDLWLARFALGVAYVQAQRYPEALAELEACERRRGEATAVFLDDVPTFRYLATLPYWLGRAKEGLGQAQPAIESYRKFLELRPDGTGRLAADAQRRAGVK